jgi:hypothetical protein
MKTTYQKYAAKHWDQPENLDHYAKSTFGLHPDALERHLQIMSDLRTQGGGLSRADKVWLLKQAQQAGRDLKGAAQQIARVQRIADPEARARAYVVASGAPSQELVDHALEMSRAYSTTWGSTLAEERLQQRDAIAAKSGSQFRFNDTPEMKQARHESTAVRRTIEAALHEKGLAPRPAQSLDEEQARAREYAAKAADRLESTPPSASLRDHIEGAWHADQAFQRLNDTGASRDSMGSVMERTDDQAFSARAIDG